jgi:hypothetical protein
MSRAFELDDAPLTTADSLYDSWRFAWQYQRRLMHAVATHRVPTPTTLRGPNSHFVPGFLRPYVIPPSNANRVLLARQLHY